MGTLVEESGLDMVRKNTIIEGTAAQNRTRFGGIVVDNVYT